MKETGTTKYFTDKIDLVGTEIIGGEKDGTQCVILDATDTNKLPTQIAFTSVTAKLLYDWLGEYLVLLDKEKESG